MEKRKKPKENTWDALATRLSVKVTSQGRFDDKIFDVSILQKVRSLKLSTFERCCRISLQEERFRSV